jgi:hypothetical protein
LAQQLAWSNWESLGGVLYSGPDACSWGPGRLDIFVKAAGGDIDHKWYDGRWSDAYIPNGGWESLGAPPANQVWSDPTAVSWGNGRIDIFVKGTTNALWHKWYDGRWSDAYIPNGGWESLGGVLYSGPDACSWGPGRLDIFVKAAGGDIDHKWYDGRWSDAHIPNGGWESLGTPSDVNFSGIVTDPTAVSWGKGRMDIFVVHNVRYSTFTLWRRFYDRIPFPSLPGSMTGFHNWEPLGAVDPDVNSIDACSWGPGRLDIFAAQRGSIVHKWFDNGYWHDWEPLGSPPGDGVISPTAVSWGNGRIDIFARGVTYNALWHKWADLYTF